MMKKACSARGQSLIEMAMILPLLVVLTLGVVEISYALLDQHVVAKVTREGSNMISRNTSLADATNALKTMSTRPVNFDASSKVIFSVIKKVATTGAANYDNIVLYQRYEFGPIAGSSQIMTSGGGSFSGPPDYIANNSDNDTNLRVTNLPTTLLPLGGLMYITEVYTTHDLITPFFQFGLTVPNTLYSIAYF